MPGGRQAYMPAVKVSSPEIGDRALDDVHLLPELVRLDPVGRGVGPGAKRISEVATPVSDRGEDGFSEGDDVTRAGVKSTCWVAKNSRSG